MGNQILLVIDLQKGFINNSTEHLLNILPGLIKFHKQKSVPVIFTRFINNIDSSFVRLMNWHKFTTSSEIDITDELLPFAEKVFDKHGIYSAFTNEFSKYIESNDIQKIYLSGIATDGCILKTAVDCFERGIEPVIISEACASHGGEEIHNAGLTLLKRFIGENQIKTISDLIGKD